MIADLLKKFKLFEESQWERDTKGLDDYKDDGAIGEAKVQKPAAFRIDIPQGVKNSLYKGLNRIGFYMDGENIDRAGYSDGSTLWSVVVYNNKYKTAEDFETALRKGMANTDEEGYGSGSGYDNWMRVSEFNIMEESQVNEVADRRVLNLQVVDGVRLDTRGGRGEAVGYAYDANDEEIEINLEFDFSLAERDNYDADSWTPGPGHDTEVTLVSATDENGMEIPLEDLSYDDDMFVEAVEEAAKDQMYGESVQEGAKVDRMVGHIKQSEKELGKSDKEAENIAWATANKRGMLDNKNKKVNEDSIDDNWKENWKNADKHPMNDKNLHKKYLEYVKAQDAAHKPHISWGSWALRNSKETKKKTESVTEGKTTMYDIKKGLTILNESRGETLEHILGRFKHEVNSFKNGGELDNDLYDELYDYYSNAGEMPYGVMKARTGDPFQWVSDRLDSELSSNDQWQGDGMAPIPDMPGEWGVGSPESEENLIQDDAAIPTIEPGEEMVTEGLESIVTDILSNVGLDHGYDFFFDNGLVVIGRSTAKVAINALKNSGQVADPFIETMDGEEVRIKFGQKAEKLVPTTDIVNDLAAEPELEEAIGGRRIDLSTLEVDGVETWDSPDFADAYFSYGEWEDGTPMSDQELDEFSNRRSDLVHELASVKFYNPGERLEGFSESKESNMKKQVNESINVNVSAEGDEALQVLKALSGLGGSAQVTQTSGEMSPMSNAPVASPCAQDQMKSLVGLFSEGKEPERSADREDDDDDTNSDEEDDLTEDKAARKARGDETYENTPDEKTAGVEASIPAGDDMHKKKGANPNWQGDNAMRTKQFESKESSNALEESLWQEYNAIKEGKIDDLKDKQQAEKDDDWWGTKDKGEKKNAAKKVSGKAYGGSAQKDAEEKDTDDAPKKKRGRPAKKK